MPQPVARRETICGLLADIEVNEAANVLVLYYRQHGRPEDANLAHDLDEALMRFGKISFVRREVCWPFSGAR